MLSLAGVNNNSDKKTQVKKVGVKKDTKRSDYDDEIPEEEDVQIKSKQESKFKLPSLSRQFGKQQQMVK
jgi:hypothetical protein